MAEIVNFTKLVEEKIKPLREKVARNERKRLGIHTTQNILPHANEQPYRHEDDKFIYRVGAMTLALKEHCDKQVQKKWVKSIAKAREVIQRNKNRV